MSHKKCLGIFYEEIFPSYHELMEKHGLILFHHANLFHLAANMFKTVQRSFPELIKVARVVNMKLGF